MPVSAKRIKSMGYDTNVPVTDLSSLGSNDVLNNSLNLLNEKLSSDEVKSLLNKTDEKLTDILAQVREGKLDFDSGVREAKGLFTKIKDVTGLPTKELDKIISGIFRGKSPLASAFSSGLNKGCKDRVGSYKGLGKPYDLKVNCGGKTKKSTSRCNNGEFGDLLNKLTNGAYGGSINDLNSALQSLVALSMYGYDLNMCGVFSALSLGIDNKGVLNRGAAGIFNALNSSNNTLGFLDLAGSSSGLTPLLEYPGAIAGGIKSFTIPKDIKEMGISELSTRMFAAEELLNSKYRESMFDGTLSIADAEYGMSEDYRLAMKIKASDNVIDENNMDFVTNDDSVFSSAAFACEPDFWV